MKKAIISTIAALCLGACQTSTQVYDPQVPLHKPRPIHAKSVENIVAKTKRHTLSQVNFTSGKYSVAFNVEDYNEDGKDDLAYFVFEKADGPVIVLGDTSADGSLNLVQYVTEDGSCNRVAPFLESFTAYEKLVQDTIFHLDGKQPQEYIDDHIMHLRIEGLQSPYTCARINRN